MTIRVPKDAADSQTYVRQIKALRKAKTFHTFVEERLSKICMSLFPDFHPIKEIQGLAGGRNDLLLFEFSGRKVLIEIFGTASQVSRDLRILDNTKADVKIAVLVDREVDPKVFERFLRENPENTYPFLFVGELVREGLVEEGRLKLHQLVTRSELHRFARFFRVLSSSAFSRFISACKQEGMLVLSEEDVRLKRVNFQQVFATIILGKLARLGIHGTPLKRLAAWMSKEGAVDFAVRNVWFGRNVYLLTDLEGNFGFYSDTEVLDFLRAEALGSKPTVILSINATIAEIFSTYCKGKERPPPRPRIRAGVSEIFETIDGRTVTLSLPAKTHRIVIFAVAVGEGAETAAQLKKKIEFVTRRGSRRKRL